MFIDLLMTFFSCSPLLQSNLILFHFFFFQKGTPTNQVDLELLKVVLRKADDILEDDSIADLMGLQRGEVGSMWQCSSKLRT